MKLCSRLATLVVAAAPAFATLAVAALPALATLALALAVTACTEDAPTSAPTGTLYDLSQGASHAEPEYRAAVARLDLLELAVQTPHGTPELYVGHPVTLRAELDLDAEPLDAPLFVGLRAADDTRCVVGELGVEHLTDMIDAAAKANQALGAHDPGIDPGSLADCAASRTCAAAGEECVGFVGEVPKGYDPNAPLATDAPAIPDGNTDEPAFEPTEEVTTWQCMRPAFAGSVVAAAAAAPAVITPADLAGQVEHGYVLTGEAILPESCAALVGKADVEAWASFDPEWLTVFPTRPGGQDESHVDATPTHDAAVPVDATAALEAQAYASRLALTTPVGGGVHADPGVDIELRALTTGSSVVPLHEARADEPWDFDVTAAFSVDGALDAAHEAALATAEEDFRFTLRPIGDPRPGCAVADPTDAEPAALAITDAQGHEADDAVVAEHAERTVKEHGFGLHLAGELRARVLDGDWSCWDRFEVEACLTTDLGEATAPGMGLDNNCARLPIAIARVPSDSDPSEKRYDPHAEEPDWDKGYDAGAGERSDYDFRVGALSSGGCDQSLLQQYTDKMERYFELDRSVKITNWYVMDYKRYLEHTGVGDNWDYSPYFLPANWFNAHIARSPWVGGLLYECTQRFEQTGVVGGDHDYCYWIRVINNDTEAYRRLRRYYLSDDGKGGDYVGFKKDPFKHTNNWFEYMCQGLHSGSVFAKYGANAPAIIKSWWDRWTNPDPIHAQYDVRQRPAETYPIGGTGGARCARNGFYMLHRYKVGDGGAVELVDDDGAFFSEYLPRIREKAAAKAAADQIWNTLVSTCTSISAPAWSSETISQTRLAPALYPTKTVSFGAVNFGAEGGMLSDALVNKVTGDFVLTAGPQVRLWLDGTIAPELGGGLDVRLYDVFRAWVLGRFYNDVVSSYLSAGFHVLTFDLWKLKYKLPDQFNIPMPPPVEKEKERCRSFFYAPVPVGLELCIGVGGALGLKGDGPNDQATLKVEKVATTAGASGEKPGLVGKVIPYIAIKSSGSIGVDFFAGVAGFKLNLDPTVELQFPIEPSLHWSLKWQSATSKIAWELVPALRVGFDVVGFGGSLDFQLKWRFGDTKSWTIVDWDPLDLASMTLLEKSLTFSGETGF